jgi:glycosyltransferase involved in cell wall biosynthesis
MKLSVIVITKNEEAAIGRCLESVQWADEIIVVDSGSTDRTLAIARQFGALVHVTSDWLGPGPQRNRAIAHVTRDWVLALDADEWVSTELRDEVRAVINGPARHDAYRIPRLSSFCGRYMRHGGWWPDYVGRLFRRGSATYSDGLVHDRLLYEGSVGTLKQHLMHEAFCNLEEVLEKMNAYSTPGALMLHQKHRRASLAVALAHSLWTFFRSYILRAGFLDGRYGFMLAIANTEGTYYKYLKLMMLSGKGDKE